MSFWGENELKERLKSVVSNFSDSQIDCNAYTLKVGDEYYVSPTDQSKNPSQVTIQKLGDEQAFTIPSGQFAFLKTEEIIEVPPDAMAFISMKAKIKFKGLVNVSGFHVDPGFKGRLIFAVFNAGPQVVHLRRGQDCFLIWFADVKGASARESRGVENVVIKSDLINALPGEIQSLEGLKAKIDSLESKLTERINKLEPLHASFRTGLAIVTALVVGVVAFYLRGVIENHGAALVAPTNQSQLEQVPNTNMSRPNPSAKAFAAPPQSEYAQKRP